MSEAPRYVAYCAMHTGAPLHYVRELPGDGGVDWGYVTEAAKAKPLSKYWARRFRADCLRCGRVAYFDPPLPKKMAAPRDASSRRKSRR